MRSAVGWCGLLDELAEQSHELIVGEFRVMGEELLTADLLKGRFE
jgi:hypothetical protein